VLVRIGTVEAALVSAMLLTSAPAVPGARQSGIALAQTTSPQPAAGEHRYRVIGRIRFLLFWAGRQELGGGRLNWRLGGSMDTIALLAGSNPLGAPRGINEWGYLREQVEGERTVVFSVRTLTEDSLEEAEARLAEGTGPELFGALCSTVTSKVVRSTMTNVRTGPGVTYRDFSRLLDIVGRSTRWSFRDVPTPPGAAPGLLTALQRLLRDSVVASRASASVRGAGVSLPYIYGRTTYDLQLQDSEPIAEFRIGSQAFHDVIQSRFSIRNRTTNVETAFVMTYGTTGPLAGVPIHAAYQPHWWLKVELTLDDQIDVPPDPAGNQELLERMRAVCPARGDANQ